MKRYNVWEIKTKITHILQSEIKFQGKSSTWSEIWHLDWFGVAGRYCEKLKCFFNWDGRDKTKRLHRVDGNEKRSFK